MTSHDHEYDEKVYDECYTSIDMIITALHDNLGRKMTRLVDEVKETDIEEDVFFRIIYKAMLSPSKKIEATFITFNRIIGSRIRAIIGDGPISLIGRLPPEIETKCDACLVDYTSMRFRFVLQFENRYLVVSTIIDVSKTQKATQNAYSLFDRHHELVTPVGVMLTLYKKKVASIKEQIERNELVYIGGLERVINAWRG